MKNTLITINIAEYARICNVDAQDMIKHLQRDSFARQQFQAWKIGITKGEK